MQHKYISTKSELRELCEVARDAPGVFYDTEFVSEDTYRPELCLIQVAAADRLAVIDPYAVGDVSPFWECITAGNTRRWFMLAEKSSDSAGIKPRNGPANLFDVQIAAGLMGLEYPASYGKLIAKLLGERLPKGETRTDWRQRPLTERQIEYALLDVHFLPSLRDTIAKELTRLGRMQWLEYEMERWQDELIEAESREKWRRVSGISGLPNKAMVIVRELWRWREKEAERSNRPPRRILRDDLIVELAKRGKSDLRQIKAIRGIERSGAKRHLTEIAAAIDAALAVPQNEWPRTTRNSVPNQVNVLGQFLNHRADQHLP